MTLTKFSVPKEVEKKILTAIELKKELAKYEAEIKEALTEAMIQNDIYSIKNDAYSVTLATRATYKPSGEFSDEFSKRVLDTTKVSAYEKLNGQMPDGVDKLETKYIMWKAKESK
jgi:hypothetical protein